jgi:RimJ/RimL family protein N-acetyltransferase
MISARVLVDSDGCAFMALYQEGTRDFPNGFLPSSDEAASYTWAGAKPYFHAIFGAFDGEKLVGFCGLNTNSFQRISHRGEIGPFYVSPSHQGTQTAQILLEAVKTYAKNQNIARLELYVESQNARPRAFYEKHGFKLQAILDDMVRVGDDRQSDCFYTLYL